MPFKDTITIGGRSSTAVNLHFSVGVGGDNGPADVMLVQTMFHYLAHAYGQAMPYNGFSWNYLPEINGKCDDKTLQAIKLFQQTHAGRLLKVDGLVEPAKYGGRNIVSKNEPVLTITLMHFFASEMHWQLQGGHYISGLVKTNPALWNWLG
jgi:hypothetical protein